MKRKMAFAALPFFIMPCHALAGTSAEADRMPMDTTRTEAHADSIARMIREGVTLGEVVVEGSNGNKYRQMRSALNTINVTKRYLEANFGGSLMQTLERIPGVKAMNIGSGESKPVIRGLGFNRVVIAENGIKHEGQQWGDDHGLETDQYAVERTAVIKGPAALNYGSDAIGGVIDLRSDQVPEERLRGGANLFARSNNESIGTALRVTGREGRFWYKANATLISYADYRVPADSIPYYSYYIKLKDRRLRNTAGRELDGSLMLGYEGDRLKSYVRLAEVNRRSGFFANAHGLEVQMSDIDYDSARRDIDLPYHTVNHRSAMSHTEWQWSGGKVEGDLAYQHNRQREFAEPVSHGYMPVPPNTLERSFNKHTATANLHARMRFGKHTVRAGMNAEYQHNRRGGWGFILPDFERFTLGGYLSDRFAPRDNLILSAGIRLDRGKVDIHGYRDWYKTPTASGDSVFTQRAADFGRLFRNFSWSIGINRLGNHFSLKANLGKSFRIPIAKELGMDGINYNIFRYEKGNADLKPEVSYQLDAGASYERGRVAFELTPYLNYFPNYIYLNPTADYREGLQLYYYTQSRVFRWGFEASLSYRLLPRLRLSAEGEYLHARQLSGEKKGYSLPFSTPWSARAELRYELPERQPGDTGFAALEWVVVGSQREIVPPEEPTPGHQLLNAAIGKSFRLREQTLRLTLRGENLLNRRYFDHTSFYRLIGVPEPGRNFSLMLAWDF